MKLLKLLFPVFLTLSFSAGLSLAGEPLSSELNGDQLTDLFYQAHPQVSMAREGIEKAFAFYADHRAQFSNHKVITIVDYSQADDVKRLHVIKMESGLPLENYFAAHGQGFRHSLPSGVETIVGPYRTGPSIFWGTRKLRYSLKLDFFQDGSYHRTGLEFHSATYALTGHTQGCVGVLPRDFHPVGDVIEGESFLYIHR